MNIYDGFMAALPCNPSTAGESCADEAIKADSLLGGFDRQGAHEILSLPK
jgi:hypothetical protein